MMIQLSKPEKVSFVRCNTSLKIERVSSCAMDDLERSVRAKIAANEARRDAGLEIAGRYKAR